MRPWPELKQPFWDLEEERCGAKLEEKGTLDVIPELPPLPASMLSSRLVLRESNASRVCRSHWSPVSMTVSQVQYLDDFSVPDSPRQRGKERRDRPTLKIKKGEGRPGGSVR